MLSPILTALGERRPPAFLDHYTTLFTYALDLAIITPSAVLAGVLILRRVPLGYVLAFPLLTIIVMLGPVIVASTVFQKAAGVSFTPAEAMGPIGGFLVLGALGVWVLTSVLRNVGFPPSTRLSI